MFSKRDMKKLYYSIGEVSKILDVEQHILRYWEKEFTLLKTKKNRAGNRVYSVEDLEFLKLIKNLLEDKNLSIKQANQLFEIYKSKNEIIKNFDNIVKGYKGNPKETKSTKVVEKSNNGVSLTIEKKNEIKALFDDIMGILNS